MDRRAQATGIARFFLGLIVAAVMVWIIGLTADPLLGRASNSTTSSTANQGTTYLQQAVDWWPIFALLVSVFGLVVLAIYRREVRR